MKDEDFVYYWYCPACKILEHQPADSLAHARTLLEAHEKEKHKGKQVGNYGKKKPEK
ncbi:MAG: hypothetical protein WC119_00675 [Synergistaceae bacterium]